MPSVLDNPGSQGPWTSPTPTNWEQTPYTGKDIFEEIEALIDDILNTFKFEPEGGGLKVKNLPSIPISVNGPTVAGSGSDEVTDPVINPETVPKTDTDPSPYQPVDEPENRPDPAKTETPAPTPPAVINSPIPEGKPGGGRLPLPGR